MPVITQNYVQNNLQMLNESLLSEQFEAPNITVSELLFPAFNMLVPLLFEHVMPHLPKTKNQADVSVLVGSMHQLIGFAFKTQVFNKIIWKQVS